MKIEIVVAIIIGLALAAALIVIGIFITKQKRRKPVDTISAEPDSEAEETEPPAETELALQPSTEMLKYIDEFEIATRSGQTLTLSQLGSSNSLSTKQFQEIAMRGSAVGAGLVQGSMPVLAQAQTLDKIRKALPNEPLFTATGPLNKLMTYSDGTVSSITRNGSRFSFHAGFKEVDISKALEVTQVLNPAAVIGGGMQAMAMISGQYYMDQISEQLAGIEQGINKLIGFHHDENVGKLRSIENRLREIVVKKHVDDTDIIALQAGIREADSVLNEYSLRLERLSQSGEVAEIRIRKLLSRISAARELQNLGTNIEDQELYLSFQMCLFASKLLTEGKKAEVATRMKMGETEKAMEAFETFCAAYKQSFAYNAADFLDRLFDPVQAQAETLIQRQWIESKKSSEKLESLEGVKIELNDHISCLTEGEVDKEMMRRFSGNREILYIPAADASEQRVFISVEDEEDETFS